jgi:2-beta-glucuronyltransferase
MRSRRKANIHFIVDELRRRGQVRVFSMGFSLLSRLKGRDPRIGLETRANRVETWKGIENYLWWTPVHPARAPERFAPLTRISFDLYRRLTPNILRSWAGESDVIFVESGTGVLFTRQLRQWAPSAKLIYVASDDMQTIGVDRYVQDVFRRDGHLMDIAGVPSKMLANVMPPDLPTYFVPHGIDHAILKRAGASPFNGGINAVSVGSMLFDAAFFAIAAERFPKIQFHVIGSGAPRRALPSSVKVYGEMPYEHTLAFIKHADFGIAPYKQADFPYYLADTSMKLMQYEFFGIPAVCPTFVAGKNHPLRFGYEPGNVDSIISAINSSLEINTPSSTSIFSWSDVVDRLLEPTKYSDTKIGAEH